MPGNVAVSIAPQPGAPSRTHPEGDPQTAGEYELPEELSPMDVAEALEKYPDVPALYLRKVSEAVRIYLANLGIRRGCRGARFRKSYERRNLEAKKRKLVLKQMLQAQS